MQINPMCEELRGGSYKKVAQSSASGTHAQKLAMILTAFSSLSSGQKMTAFMMSNAAIYHVTSLTGVFGRPSLSVTTVYLEQLNLTSNTYLVNRNGVISDISTNSDASVFELWVRES